MYTDIEQIQDKSPNQNRQRAHAKRGKNVLIEILLKVKSCADECADKVERYQDREDSKPGGIIAIQAKFRMGKITGKDRRCDNPDAAC